jgi:starvation-inducible DNA-binding protein
MKSNNVKTVEKLNQVLADLQVVYQNFRTMHWLVKGHYFFQLHNAYEEYYNDTAEVVDEVAERVLMLGGVPQHQFSDYVENAKVKVVNEVPDGMESVKIAIDNYEYLLEAYHDINSHAADNDDEGTVVMFSELIASTEKKLWMLKASLS